MIRLFSQLAIAIATATLLTALVTRFALDDPPERTVLALVAGHAERIALELSKTPPVRRGDLAAQLSGELGYPVRLEPARLSAQTRTERRRGGIAVVARVPGNPGQVVLGPVPFGADATLSAVVALGLLLAWAAAGLLCWQVFSRIRELELGEITLLDAEGNEIVPTAAN